MKNIVLIGMSGVGKTTIGRILSKFTNRKFIDMDELIEDEANMEIHNIFSKYGEVYFRDMESELSKKLSKYKSIVIATGGGVIEDYENIINLRRNSIIIFLYCSIDLIINNLKGSSTVRPLLNNKKGISKSVEKLYNRREKLYLKSSDFIVCVENKSAEEVAIEVWEKFISINSLR